jgi:hypothetical protein
MTTYREKTLLFGLLRPLVIFGAASIVTVASADVPTSPLCADGECQPMISVVDYQKREGFKITDGKTEAIIVPSIGRIMSYKKVGGENLIWNAPNGVMRMWGWNNYGGDKTWLGPQNSWTIWHSPWPPDTSIDDSPHEIEFITGGKLRMTSPLSPATGIRFVRTIYFDTNGELVIEQTAQKEKGAKVKGSIWNITQAIPGDAIFLPMNENSPYKNNFYAFYKGNDLQKAETINPKLLRVQPVSEGGGWKVGTDAPVSSLASVKDGVAFVQKTAKPEGIYPDGAVDNAGFPVELFINGDKDAYYAELELLGPLRDFSVGTKWTHTLRWSLNDMPSKDVTSKEVVEAVQNLLESK